MAEKHDVTLLSFLRSDEERKFAAHLAQFCGRVETCLLGRSLARDISVFGASFLRGKPFIVARDYVAQMDAMLRRLLAWRAYDVIHVDHLQMAQFVPDGARVATLLDEHNVEWRIIERIAHSDPSRIKRLVAKHEYPKLCSFETLACEKADYVLTVTEEDKAVLSGSLGTGAEDRMTLRIEAIPIGVDIEYFDYSWKPTKSANSMFVGTLYWPPNIDSVTHFSRDILPLVREEIPDAGFDIVGLRPAKAVVGLGKSIAGVDVTGSVDDVRPYMSRSRVFVVPLRAGSGMRVKILNAMAVGVPVVSTSIGCEGIEGLVTVRKPADSGANRQANIWIADSRAEFSEAVVTLTRDEELATMLSHNGRKLMVDKYDWEIIRQKILEFYGEIETDLKKKANGHNIA